MYKIKLVKNLIQITPTEGLLHLKEELSYTHRSMEYGQMVFNKRCLFEVIDNCLYTSSGFIKRVKTWFKRKNLPYTLEDTRQFKKPEIQLDRLCDLRTGQAEILGCISIYDGGIIDVPTAFGKSTLIVEICKMYPTLNIVIVSTAKSVIHTIYTRLVAEIPTSQIGKVGDGVCDIARITVSTAKSLKKIDPDKVDLLIFDEVHQAAAPSVAEILAHFHSCRLFGLTASVTGRSDGADKAVEAIFGKVLYKIKYQDAVNTKNVTAIEVHLYRVSGALTFKTPMGKKRLGLWRNNKRNNLIAKIVNGQDYVDKQVLILVESVEHLFYLSKLLPDFSLAFDKLTPVLQDKLVKRGILSPEYKQHSKQELVNLQDDFGKKKVLKAIATGIWNTGVDFPQLDVCVRAGGGASTIQSVQTPGRLSRISADKSKGILIDFLDDFNKGFCDNSKKRIREYKKFNWTIIKHY